MPHSHSFVQRKKTRAGRRIVLLISIVLLWLALSYMTGKVSLDQSVVIKKGDTLYTFFSALSNADRTRMKVYIRTHEVDVNTLQLGTYEFSGSYSPKEFLEVINNGPVSEYVRFTVLEGWSIYDIDAALVQKGFIQGGEYIAYVSSADTISSASQGYTYIASTFATHQFPSLEGRLYPDTYFLDPTKDPVAQLVRVQLKAFDEKVYQPYASAITAFPDLLEAKGFMLSYEMDLWNILRLASVIEKEERNLQNKPTVAGIFFNRLQQGTLLGADITLCYGLQQPYETCTPAFINANVGDADNVYNTRTHRGLPPTPIANPSVDTIRSVIEFSKTNYFYYLHDNNGIIRYAETLQGHNENISKYLR